jgi:predicted component of type VI protein secretion system
MAKRRRVRPRRPAGFRRGRAAADGSAGLDSTQAAARQQEEAMVIAGRLIRATAEGLQSVLRSRSLIKRSSG